MSCHEGFCKLRAQECRLQCKRRRICGQVKKTSLSYYLRTIIIFRWAISLPEIQGLKQLSSAAYVLMFHNTRFLYILLHIYEVFLGISPALT